MIIKFLFYLFLFYVVFRYLFGSVRINVFHNHQHQNNYHHPEPERHEEGKITIDPKVTQKRKGNSDKLGEYVDFEEVK